MFYALRSHMLYCSYFWLTDCSFANVRSLECLCKSNCACQLDINKRKWWWCSGLITQQEVVDLYRREAWRAEARVRRTESRDGVLDCRSGVFEYSRHSVWLLRHLNSVRCLERLSTPSMDKCKWQNDREGLHFFIKHHAYRKILKYILCRVMEPSKKMPDLNCEVQDLLFEVVDLKQEVPDLRSGGIRPNLTLWWWITSIMYFDS